jgi:hypothetical protein
MLSSLVAAVSIPTFSAPSGGSGGAPTSAGSGGALAGGTSAAGTSTGSSMTSGGAGSGVVTTGSTGTAGASTGQGGGATGTAGGGSAGAATGAGGSVAAGGGGVATGGGAGGSGAGMGGAGDGGTACATNDTCSAGLYCKKQGCSAIGVLGQCTTRPTECDSSEAPICGCDGFTYFNTCLAEMNGQNVGPRGVCGANAITCINSGYNNAARRLSHRPSIAVGSLTPTEVLVVPRSARRSRTTMLATARARASTHVTPSRPKSPDPAPRHALPMTR